MSDFFPAKSRVQFWLPIRDELARLVSFSPPRRDPLPTSARQNKPTFGYFVSLCAAIMSYYETKASTSTQIRLGLRGVDCRPRWRLVSYES